MKPLDRLSEYLGAVERRMRLLALTRGAAVTAAAALALTVLAVLVANHFSFSSGSVIGARVLLFLGLALALAAALIVPVIRLNRRRAARAAERRYPQFEERLLTFTERMEQNPGDPFLALLADDTLARGRSRPSPRHVARSSWIFSFSSAAVVRRAGADLAGRVRPGIPGLRHVAAVGRAAQGRHEAVLCHPGGSRQSHRAQTRRPVDHRHAHRLQRAQGAILRQIRQRLEVGTGRDAPRAGQLVLPVSDRRRARIAGVLRGGRRRPVAHLQAQRGGPARGEEHQASLTISRPGPG